MSMYREHLDSGKGGNGVMSNGYLSTQPYSHGTSSLPVERPVDYLGVCEIVPPTSHDYPEGYFACPEFFRTVGPDFFYFSPLPHNTWTYEMRRTAQAILPHLYLGPVSAAKDIEVLRREGITLLLAIRSRGNVSSQLVRGDKAAAALGIQSRYIEVDSEQELISVFQVIIQQINDHLCRCAFHRSRNNIDEEPHKKVLVFCDTGNNLAAGVVAAYLMAMFNYDAVKAMSNLSVRRLSVIFDEPMRRALRAFEDIIVAVRTVYQNASNRSAPTLGSVGLPAQWIYTSDDIAKKKRGSCVITEEDAQALNSRFGGGDEERFAGREFTAPFEDA
ncbi:hypothetical protein KEM56_007698 [Ascosphaera pollenicola]|nr:hypothetical protein KEM56_007698 [Ascosphaera pollenicola]